MQVDRPRRTNESRSEAMRARLLEAARALFVDEGYAATGTPAIVEAAGVTRGALYHHFADKQALCRAVLELEAKAVAQAIEEADDPSAPALDRLLAGAKAYLEAMLVPGRTRPLLIDGPAVLGDAERRGIEARHGDASLRAGLETALVGRGLAPALLDALASGLSAMFERAALDIAAGARPQPYAEAIKLLITALAADDPAVVRNR